MFTIGLSALLVAGQGLAKDFYSDGNIMAGDLWDSVYIHDTLPNHTTVNMSGGQVFGGIYSYNSSILNLSGGQVNTMLTYDTSILNMTGGRLSQLNLYENSRAYLSRNENTNFDIYARDQSIINFSGTAQGTEVQALNTSIINISGGGIVDLTAYNIGVISIYGGNITNIGAQDNSIVNIFGYDLFKSSTGGIGNGFVQGYFNDHSFFNIYFRVPDTYSHVNLIPEPITVLLLGVGGLFLRKKD
jgi:hypothetical protein